CNLPSQRCFQPPDLGFAALDHLFLPNQMVTANHTSSPENNSRSSSAPPPQNFDSTGYGGGIRPHHVQRDRIGTWEVSRLAVVVACCVPGTAVRIGKARSRSR